MKEQVTINSYEFSQKSHEIHGTIAARDLGRLKDVLFSDDGKLEYQLLGGLNAQGKPELRLTVQGELMLVCQRCVGAMSHPVDSSASFIVVASEDMMPSPDEEPDEVDYLVADPKLNIATLVEDEILLGLPMAPLHETADCGVNTSGAKEQKESPFKVLQGLKFDKS